MATESSPPKIERFRLRLIPASVLAVLGCITLGLEGLAIYEYFHPQNSRDIERHRPIDVFLLQATINSLLALAFLVASWTILNRRWTVLIYLGFFVLFCIVVLPIAFVLVLG